MTEHTQFRAVLRGYDPAQVDQVVAELTAAAEAARQEAAGLSVQASKLEAGHAELRSQLDARDAQLTKLREASRTAAAGGSFHQPSPAAPITLLPSTSHCTSPVNPRR